jgi:hypothetical protein
VSEVLASLRDQGLGTPTATPVVPELFWAAADAWRTRWLPLATAPTDAAQTRLSGSKAAGALGAGIVITGDWPLELYVSDTWSAAEPGVIAPVREGSCRRRHAPRAPVSRATAPASTRRLPT